MRRGRAPAVAGIAVLHLLQDARVYSLLAPFPQLFRSPRGAGLEAGGQKDLHIRLGADDGGDVAAVENGARLAVRRLCGEAALKRQELRPHRWIGGNL